MRDSGRKTNADQKITLIAPLTFIYDLFGQGTQGPTGKGGDLDSP